MALTGEAFLCIWNDFDVEYSDEYERWHTLEHVPERVASPGFVSGRRYAALNRHESGYLTLYELETLAALHTPEYVDLQENPTPWSARMRPHFRNVLRIPFERVASAGQGCAGHLAVYAFETPETSADVALRLIPPLNDRLAEQHLAGFHIGRALSIPAYGVFDLAAEPESGRQRIILLQEVSTAAKATELLEWFRGASADYVEISHVVRAETCSLSFNVLHEEVVTRWRRLQA